MNKRIDVYDIAKGLGILIVIVGHSVPTGSAVRLFIYSFHMPLFFILSGLVMKNEEEFSLKASLLKEKKLIANYAFYSALYLIFDIIVRCLLLQTMGVKSIILDCWQTVILFGINVLWFISTLLVGKILVRALCCRFKRTLSLTLIALIMFSISCIIALFVPDRNSGLSFVQFLIFYLVVFVLREIMMSSFILIGFLVKDYVRKIVTTISPVIGGGVWSDCFMLNSRPESVCRQRRLSLC